MLLYTYCLLPELFLHMLMNLATNSVHKSILVDIASKSEKFVSLEAIIMVGVLPSNFSKAVVPGGSLLSC